MTVRIKDVRVILTAPEGINLTAVRVDTSDDGLYGLGCATFAYRPLATKCIVEEYLKPLLVGRDAENITELWHLMNNNAYWRNGPVENNAIAGIDIALWDIKGKMAGMPIYQLLGGKCREGVLIYRHAEGRDASEICEQIDRYREQGVTHIRCQMGGYGGGRLNKAPLSAPVGAPDGLYLDSRKYMNETVKLFDEIRSREGFDIELLHDVHERISPRDAIRFAKEMEPFGLFFLEDVLPIEQSEWMRLLRNQTAVPIAQGELYNNPSEWKFLIAERLIDFLRLHVSQAGGITPARKAQLMAEEFGVKTAWHGSGDLTPIGHATNIHLDMASHNFGIQEWSGTEPPNFIIQDLKGPAGALTEVFSGLPEQRGAYVYPNGKPGHGVDIDEKEAAKYPIDSSVVTWTQTRLRDGTLQTP